MRPKLLATADTPLPSHLSGVVQKLYQTNAVDSVMLAAFTQEVADQYAELAGSLLANLGDQNAPLGIAIGDFYLPECNAQGAPYTLPLCDTLRLAEVTGMTVVDEFAARDVAAGGNGCVLPLIPYWLLLADRSLTNETRQAKVFIEHHDTYRITYLPPHAVLADLLPPIYAEEATTAEQALEILEHKTSPQAEEPPVWPQVGGAIIADADPFAWDDWIQNILPQGRAQSLSDLNFSPESLAAAGWATLAMLQIDQAPANMPHQTGAETRRLLGRLTPGNPVNWARLLRAMLKVQPGAMSLLRAM